MAKTIIIIEGPQRHGKSESLLELIRKLKNCSGFINTKDIIGRGKDVCSIFTLNQTKKFGIVTYGDPKDSRNINYRLKQGLDVCIADNCSIIIAACRSTKNNTVLRFITKFAKNNNYQTIQTANFYAKSPNTNPSRIVLNDIFAQNLINLIKIL